MWRTNPRKIISCPSPPGWRSVGWIKGKPLISSTDKFHDIRAWKYFVSADRWTSPSFRQSDRSPCPQFSTRRDRTALRPSFAGPSTSPIPYDEDNGTGASSGSSPAIITAVESPSARIGRDVPRAEYAEPYRRKGDDRHPVDPFRAFRTEPPFRIGRTAPSFTDRSRPSGRGGRPRRATCGPASGGLTRPHPAPRSTLATRQTCSWRRRSRIRLTSAGSCVRTTAGKSSRSLQTKR